MNVAGAIQLPDGIERLPQESIDAIIKVALEQHLHRQQLDLLEMELAKRGQWMAIGVSVFFGIIALWVTLAGHDTVGGIAAGTTVVALPTAFIAGRRSTPTA